MAHKKAGGTSKNLRDSAGKRLGIKVLGGQPVKNGNIICRQRGTKWRAGTGVKVGKDHTIYAIQDGIVSFSIKKKAGFDNNKYSHTFINVIGGETPPVLKKSARKVKEAKIDKKAKAQTKEKVGNSDLSSVQKSTEVKEKVTKK